MNADECQRHVKPFANRLRKLAEANHSLAEIESLDKLFLRLMELAKEVTAAEAALIFLYNPNDRLLEIVSIKDDRFGDRAEKLFKGTVKLKMGEGIAGRVAEHRKSIMVDDAQGDPRFSKKADYQRNFTTRTLICVPLVHRDELLGVLSVLNVRGKPRFDQEDLAILESFADIAAVAIIRSRLLKYRVEQERFRAELEAAAKIQKLFWPKLPDLGEGNHIWAFTEPAASVGGDLYDVIPMPDRSWVVYVADVAGKGLPAALMMAALSAKIRSIAPLHEDVSNLLTHVNQEMHALMSEEGFFATIVISKYWPATGRVQIARAGHPYPLWVTENRLRDRPQIDGIALGVASGTEYKGKELTLPPGEAVLLISDGVSESKNEKGELFGDDRLTDYFKMVQGPPWAEGLLRRIDSWRGNAPMNDDLTLLEIWRDHQ